MISTVRKLGLALILLTLLLWSRSSARAQDRNLLILEDPETPYPLDLHLEYLEDPERALNIDEVTQPEVSAQFIPNSREIPNFGISKSAYWFRFRVLNQTGQESWRLAFSNARVGLVDLYIADTDGSGWVHKQAGTYLPASTREYAHPHFVFPVSLTTSKEAVIYLRLESNLPMRLSLLLWSADLFEQYNHNYFGFIGLFYGIVGIMAVYNLLLFLFMRRMTYLYYFFFIIFYTLNTAASDGTALLYLYPNISFKYAVFSFATLGMIFLTLLVRDFLELESRLPWLNRVMIALTLLQVLTSVLYVVFPQVFSLGSVMVLVFAILAIVGSILVWRQGGTSARYFLFAWFGVLVNAVFLNSANIRLVSGYPLYDIGQYISTILLVVLFSLALADQINVLKTKANTAEVALYVSEKRFRHLYERTPVGIAIADASGRLEQANQAFQKLLGYDETELRKKSYLELIYPDDREHVEYNFENISQGAQPSYGGEIRYLRKDGHPVWVTRSVSTLRGENGKIQNTFAMVSDISDRKKQESELRQYSENLEEMVIARTRELERSRDQLMILNLSSKVINTAGLDIEQVYITIRAATAWLVPAEVFSLCLVDHDTGQYEDVFLVNGDQHIQGISRPLTGSFIETMLENDTCLKVDDFQSDLEKEACLGWDGYLPGIRSGIAVLLRGSKDVLGVLSVQSYQPQSYVDTDQSILESFATHVAITLENIQLYQQAEKSAVLEERQRLARELHDSVTQLLYSMALMSGGWATKTRQGQLLDHAERFGQIEELSLQALKEMRLLIHQLSPSILGEVGLVKAIQGRMSAVEEHVNVDAQLRLEGDFPVISPVVEEELYFIIQEALNNALRHAYATRTHVVIRSDERYLHITIEDNGRGYDPSQPSSGMGTTIMMGRAKAIDAKVQIHSKLGEGTQVRLTLELDYDKKGRKK